MTRALGLFVAAICLLCGAGVGARAQGVLPAGAIALTSGATLTLDGLQISVSTDSCNDGGGTGRGAGIACSSDIFLVPVSGPDPEVLIEAADGDDPGVSTLEPIFSYSCPTTGTCPGGTYDLSLTLSVQATTNRAEVTSVSQVLTGSASGLLPATSDWPGDVHLSEGVTSGESDLCGEDLNLAQLTAACPAFAAQSSLSVSKDLGLTLSGVTNGSTLTLWSVAQIFTPAPEPASWATMLVGLFILGGARRRQQA